MKIPNSVFQNYLKDRDTADAIKKIVEPVLTGLCSKNDWLFVSRIKTPDSYAQKLECSYTECKLDDFYACSIIVPNKSMVLKTIGELKKIGTFVLKQQKPRDLKKTNVDPDIFRFDSVRLYFSTSPSSKGPKPIDNEIFEVQIKTFLEYVWGIVSHDLDYKSNEYSWGIGKVCSQIKALLDSAELALTEAKTLSNSDAVNISNDKYTKKQKFIDIFKTWTSVELPADLKRMVDNIMPLTEILGINVDQLDQIVKKHSVLSSVSLSPYYIVIKGLLLEYKNDFFTKINQNNIDTGKKFNIKLIKELDIEDMIPDFDENQYDFIKFIK